MRSHMGRPDNPTTNLTNKYRASRRERRADLKPAEDSIQTDNISPGAMITLLCADLESASAETLPHTPRGPGSLHRPGAPRNHYMDPAFWNPSIDSACQNLYIDHK